MECRSGCGACCIAPSIHEAIPAMPAGKPAGVRCVQLDDQNRCRLFFSANRPVVCAAFKAERSICGDNREQALVLINRLELATEVKT